MKTRIFLIVCLFLALAAFPGEPKSGFYTGHSPTDHSAEPVTQTATSLADLPLAAQSAISSALGEDDETYLALPVQNGYQAANSAQGLKIEWNSQGVRMSISAGDWQMRLAGWGYGENWRGIASVAPQAKANRVEYRRGRLIEWYLNGPLGLEQGFTIQAAPGANRSGEPLTLALTQSGILRATREGDRLAIRGTDGAVQLRYGGLAAIDAAGQALPAWLEMRGDQVWLRVDDRSASYPLIVDPFVQNTKLLPGGDSEDRFGSSVALSTDGNTALIGAPDHWVGGHSDQGSAYIFVRNEGFWTPQAKLVASDGAEEDYFGCSVAISGDGYTALVGASMIDDDKGSAYVFVRSGTAWYEQKKLTASDGEAGDGFGYSVALSGDGNTALIGAVGDCVDGTWAQGSAYIFGRSSAVWSQEAHLIAPDGGEFDLFGLSVALSANGYAALVGTNRAAVYAFFNVGWWVQTQMLTASDGEWGDGFGSALALDEDGNTALIGADGDDVGTNVDQGSTYVFHYTGTNWSQQAKLTASDGVANDCFGNSMSLSADGDTALVGAYGDDGERGSAYVFVRSGTAWSQQRKLAASDGAIYDHFGSAVALSGDGNTALAGADADDVGNSIDQGSTYAFTRLGSIWFQQAKLVSFDGEAHDVFGCAVALDQDGDTALVGAYLDDIGSNTNQGSVYVFVRSSGFWSQQAQLTTSDGEANDWFGRTVALSADGNVALVGAPEKSIKTEDAQGLVYVFARNGYDWFQEAELISSDGEAGDLFGSSVALRGDGSMALIGAEGDDTSRGSAYIFELSGWWDETAKLVAADGASADGFGVSVALDEDGKTALIGAVWDNVGGNIRQGSAYIFNYDGAAWNQQAQLTASDGAEWALFGKSVALSHDGNEALVGAYGDTNFVYQQGAAYVFERTGTSWSQQAQLTASDGMSKDNLGWSVSLNRDGNIALVGAPGANTSQGSAYIFLRAGTTWSQQGKLTASDGEAKDKFGYAVALSGNGYKALIGAMEDWIKDNEDQGSAYTFNWIFPIYFPLAVAVIH